MRIRHVELVDIQLRDEEDGRWRMRVLSRIGGHGYHYFESPEFALRWLAEMIEAERRGKGPPPAGVAMDWQPIETAPKDGTPFIAANRFDAFRAFYDVDEAVWVCENDGKWFGQLQHPPTHWMPLPDPPAASPRSERSNG